MRFADQIGRLAQQLPPFESGHVWLAGAGPGGSGTLTIEVLWAISRADAIIYDALVNPEILAFADGAELHFAGKRGGEVSAAQEAINGLMIHLAGQGKRVLRLKGGDPYVFGRGGEEVLALAEADIPFRVLPGITSALAALAGADIPATMRGFNRAIILATGHAAGAPDDLDWRSIAATGQPVVVYMGLTNITRIAERLISGGMPPETPAAAIMSASLTEERVLVATAATIAREVQEQGFRSPTLILFGEIVRLRERLRSAKAQGGGR